MSIRDGDIDLYDVMGLAPSCSLADVKKSYRRLLLSYHPDKVPPERKESAARMYELVTLAYAVLGKESTRREYDQMYYISRRSDSFCTLKETFRLYQPPEPTARENEWEERHTGVLSFDAVNRDRETYMKNREAERLDPTGVKVKKSRCDKLVSVCDPVVPVLVVNCQEVGKEGEMYGTRYDTTLTNYVLEQDSDDEKAVDLSGDLQVKVREQKHQREKSSPTRYDASGYLILDNIITRS